jgi:hypothetical protein
MNELLLRYQIKLDQTDTRFVRYLGDFIDWNTRMFSVVGARGAGKTTLLLQHIKNHLDVNKALYVTADDFYFANNRLYQLAEDFVKYGGQYLFIDEIHKYTDWSREMKMIYDNLPDLKVVFTGSSILEIYKGQADLSRRVLSYHLHGLSFREFLNLKLGKNYPVFTFDQILNHQVRIDERPLPLFQEYLATGYYPFFLEDNYSERLRNVINLTIEVDIPAFTDMNMATSRKLRQLLYIIAQSVPFKPNMTKMGEQIGINRNQVAEYMVYLERAGLINRLLDVNPGIGSLGKVQKIYLNNTNLGSAIAGQNQNIGNARETFFFNQVQTVQPVTASKISDFEVGDMTFEIGGRNKKQTQISLAAKGFVVKDDIEYGIANIIPLWTFGFLY